MIIPMILGGAALGALTNRKDPLKGALMGGALGGVGGAVAPGLLGAGGAAGAAGAGAAETGGLLAAETGLNSAGYLAPEMSGIVAEQAAAPVVDMGTKAGMFDTLNYKTGGLLGRATDTMSAADKVMKPVGQAMQTAQMFQPKEDMPPMPMPVMPMAQGGSQTLAQIASQPQQLAAQNQQNNMMRMQQRQARIRGIGGY